MFVISSKCRLCHVVHHRTCSRIMNEDRAIMKREITINTLVVCGFVARPPSLVRFILPRWGKSFVCSTLPSSILTGRTVPQEFPRPFIRDSFVRYCELPYSRCLPTLRFNPAPLPPSLSALHLVDGGCSIKFPPSRIARVIGFLCPPPPAHPASRILPNRLPLLPLFSLAIYSFT